MTLAFVSTGSIPKPMRNGVPPSTPETSLPARQFAALLSVRAPLDAGSGVDPGERSAPLATAFDQGRLFGTAVPTADTAQADESHLSADAAAALSGNRTSSCAMTPGAVQSSAKPAIEHVQADPGTPPLSEPSDIFSAPPDMPNNAVRGDRSSGQAPKGIGGRPLIFSLVGGPAFTVIAPARVETLPRRTKLVATPKAPLSPRNGLASERAAMIGRLGPVHVSIQSYETATHILARVAEVRSDEEDALAQSLREVAEATGVEVETIFLNGTRRSSVKRS